MRSRGAIADLVITPDLPGRARVAQGVSKKGLSRRGGIRRLSPVPCATQHANARCFALGFLFSPPATRATSVLARGRNTTRAYISLRDPSKRLKQRRVHTRPSMTCSRPTWAVVAPKVLQSSSGCGPQLCVRKSRRGPEKKSKGLGAQIIWNPRRAAPPLPDVEASGGRHPAGRKQGMGAAQPAAAGETAAAGSGGHVEPRAKVAHD